MYDDDIGVLKAKLSETTLLLEVLAKVNTLMGLVKSFEDFCREVAKVLQEKFPLFTYLHIWIRDERNPETLRLLTPETKDNFRTLPVGSGIVGQAIREARTIAISDVFTCPEYLNVHTETRSELVVPLICDGNVIGAINIETTVPQTFAAYLPLIEIIAENLSHSMKHALLYRTEEQFHRLVEHMSEGVWVGDAEERTLYVNPAYTKMTGYTLEALSGKTTYDVFDQTSGEIIRKENEKRQRGIGGHYEAIYISKNGERIPIMIHAVPFGGGTMAAITDLRDAKTAEEKLLKTERFLASITQYCHEAIVGLDEKGIIQSWNIGAERMFGYKESEVLGKSTEIIIPEDRIAASELQHIIAEAKAKGFVRNFETVRTHKNGTPISINLTWSSVKDKQGIVTGFSALYRDITAQKKWERELQDRFEKMQEAYREMGKQRRQLDYLMDLINIGAGRSTHLKNIATFIVNAMVMVSRVDAATLRILDKSSGKLHLVAQSGLGEEWWSKKAIPYSGSLLESAVSQNSALKILDILNDPRYTSQALARKNNLRSALISPLQAKGEVIGSLTLYLGSEGNLGVLDDEFINIFVKQAAIVLKLAS